MNDPVRESWPVAELDPVRRLRVLADVMPWLTVAERVIPAPFEAVWDIASDLENELPRLEGGYVRSLRITRAEGERLEALVHGPVGIRDTFAIVLRRGWCWMEGRVLCAAMAATPAEEGTRFAWAAGLRLPGGGLLHPFTRRALDRTLQRLERHVLER